MKECKCCGSLSGPKADVCPNCGEASWAVVHVSEPVAKPKFDESPKAYRKGR